MQTKGRGYFFLRQPTCQTQLMILQPQCPQNSNMLFQTGGGLLAQFTGLPHPKPSHKGIVPSISPEYLQGGWLVLGMGPPEPQMVLLLVSLQNQKGAPGTVRPKNGRTGHPRGRKFVDRRVGRPCPPPGLLGRRRSLSLANWP